MPGLIIEISCIHVCTYSVCIHKICHAITPLYFVHFSVENYGNPTSTSCLATRYSCSSFKTGNEMYVQNNHYSNTPQSSRRQSTVGTCLHTYVNKTNLYKYIVDIIIQCSSGEVLYFECPYYSKATFFQ